INTDATAPIMKAADVAVAGDFLKVIPEMIAQINTLRDK
ncbi:MAG: electron transfer flavoprotein subunit alpha, partial [Clostridium sp.]